MFDRPPLPALTVRGHSFDWGTRTFLMGIINATPDSFSGDGLGDQVEACLVRAAAFEESGVDIIDIGGESTRPGHEPVPESEELKRVIPVVAAVRRTLDLPISIDTFKPVVAVEALSAGADIINCVWGAIPGIVELAARAGVPLVVMHNRVNAQYDGDCVEEVIGSLELATRYARESGIARDKIVVDPGIGFGKTPDHNVEILGRLEEFVMRLPYPLLAGVSRKSFIGKITGRAIGERAFGTAAAVALAIAGGADILRVHDVFEMRDVVDVADAVCRMGTATAPSRTVAPPLR